MYAVMPLSGLVLRGVSHAQAHAATTELAHSTWTVDPWIVIPLALTGAAYALGFARLWSRVHYGRPRLIRRAMEYSAGWLSLLLALVSPLHWWGERVFTFHMIEHEILMVIAAPLLVLARPMSTLMWGLPVRVRRSVTIALKAPSVHRGWAWASGAKIATLLHTMAIWVWHVPMFFDAAVTDILLHRLQHLSFLATAVLFWWSMVWRSNRGQGAWYTFVTMLHTSVLGALIALAPHVVYLMQTRTADVGNLSPLEDQQLAGLFMWIPAGTIYAGVTIALFALWIAGARKSAPYVARSAA